MTSERIIFSIRFGSHLYGTVTPSSDIDLKMVRIPSARDILLGMANGSVSTKRPKAEGEKNYAGEVEVEVYTLQRYLGLLAEGQTVAVDMLFAPPFALTEVAAPEWRELFANRHRLVSRRSAAFVGYCRQQANKYGIKGSRVAAARAALNLLAAALETHGSQAKLLEAASAVADLCARTEHMAIVPIEQVSGTKIYHWEVCGRKMSYTASIKNAFEIMERLVSEYGHRALQAESQQGVDWKALSHAVRVADEALELFTTGEIIFLRPCAGLLLLIKHGKVEYQRVAAEIERLLEEVEGAAKHSKLREAPDQAWIDDFVAETYRKHVVGDLLPE